MKPINNGLTGTALVNEMRAVAKRISDDLRVAYTNRQTLLDAKRSELAREKESIASMEKNDSSENVPLHIARENVSRLTIEITSLQASCDEYERITGAFEESPLPGGVCTIGSIVAIEDIESRVTWVIRLYPSGLGNAKIGAISINTPLGKALVHHKAGDIVPVKAPGNKADKDTEYRIKEVL